MLKAHAARARLPAPAVLPASVAAESLPEVMDHPWPEATLAPGQELWICISFAGLIPVKNGNSQTLPEALLRWAYRYTPVLSSDEQLLFLEVAASLNLFGGLQALRCRLQAELGSRGLSPVMACALTPRAARWLVYAGESQACIDTATLRHAIIRLPLSASGWPAKVQQTLAQMGLRTLGCCVKLPRDGFARRIGVSYLQALDEALGRRPELLPPYVLPLRFHRRVELPEESTAHHCLQAAADKALSRLGRFLRRRHAVVQGFELVLQHRGAEPTCVHVGTGRACADTVVFSELTALQLEQQALPSPVLAVELRAQAESAPRGVTLGLPGIEPGGGADDIAADKRLQAELLARLQARLGSRRVYRLDTVAEHRPERAWQVAEGVATYRLDSIAELTTATRPQRPLWLLTQPRPIAAPAGHALGPVVAERIESGWWDGADMRRDYYRITGPGGSGWWVYQDCRDEAWYLHGLFG